MKTQSVKRHVYYVCGYMDRAGTGTHKNPEKGSAAAWDWEAVRALSILRHFLRVQPCVLP